MKTDKSTVLTLLTDSGLKDNEKFNKGYGLLKNSEGSLKSQLATLNRTGFNATTLNTILYELRKLHKITPSDERNFANGPETKGDQKPVLSLFEKFIQSLALLSEDVKLKLLIILRLQHNLPYSEQADAMSVDLKAYLEYKEPFDLLKSVFSEFEEFGRSKPTDEYLAYLDKFEYPEQFKEEIAELLKLVPAADSKLDTESVAKVIELFAQSPDDLKQEIKFRERYPFLNDIDNPDEIKILVADKFSHYYAFCDAHQELFRTAVLPFLEGKKPEDCEQIEKDEIFALALKAVENFQMDQVITDELEAFKETGKVLGVHPIFNQNTLQKSVDEMTIPDASKRFELLKGYVRRDIKNAENAKTPAKKKEYQDKVELWKQESYLIKIKLEKANGAGK